MILYFIICKAFLYVYNLIFQQKLTKMLTYYYYHWYNFPICLSKVLNGQTRSIVQWDNNNVTFKRCLNRPYILKGSLYKAFIYSTTDVCLCLSDVLKCFKQEDNCCPRAVYPLFQQVHVKNYISLLYWPVFQDIKVSIIYYTFHLQK